MALLERINSMRNQGLNDAQIVNALTDEGISPLEINEALSQSMIKSAVSEQASDMQPSIMSGEAAPQFAPPPEPTAPSSMAPPQQMAPAPQAYQEQYPPQQYAEQYSPQGYDPNAYAQQGYDPNAYPQQGYDQAGYAQQGYYSQVLDVETVRDIARQQIEEAVKKMREEVSTLSKMKTEIKFEIQELENRTAKMESIIQEIQTAVIRKMGEYGQSIASISKEIRATQDSFSKVINPIMDKNRKSQMPEEISQSQAIKTKGKSKKQESSDAGSQQSSRSGPGANFEDYFR